MLYQEAGGLQGWFHRRSDDGGAGWVAPQPLPAFQEFEAAAALTTSDSGALYLLVVRPTGDDTSEVHMTAWQGSEWTPPDSLVLGVTDVSGVTVAAQPARGHLVAILQGSQNSNGLRVPGIWATTRQIAVEAPAPGPTLTPVATRTAALTAAAAPTETPAPRLSSGSSSLAGSGNGGGQPLVLSAVLAMVVVAGIVATRLARR